MASTREFLGWQVLAAMSAVILANLGFAYYGGTVINAQMAQDLKLERSMLGLGMTALLLIMGFCSGVTGWVITRIGARMTMFYSSLLIATGALFLGRFVTEGWHYVAGYGLFIGAGCIGTFLSAQACAALWFEKKRAIALAVVQASYGIGGVVAAPTLGAIIAAGGGGWRMGWYFVACVAFVFSLVSLRFVKNRPSEYGQTPYGHMAAAGQNIEVLQSDRKRIYRCATDWAVKDAMRTRVMWLILVAGFGYSIPYIAIVAHVVPHLRDLGNSPSLAASAIGILAFGSIFGKLGGGVLCERFEPRYVWMLATLSVSISVLLATQAKTPVQIYLMSMLMGLGYGAAMVCYSTIVANYFGANAFAPIMGIQLSLNTIVVAATPFLVGLAYDMQGSYVNAFYAAGSFSIAMGLLLLAATPPVTVAMLASADRSGRPEGEHSVSVTPANS